MRHYSGNDIIVGILGGGQLGKMLGQAASDWHLHIKAMDNQPGSPANGYVTDFIVGDITDYEDVLNFGRKCDIITIEIENVNIAALKQLEKEGKKVHPSPEVLDIITDKGRQKEFYIQNDLPTSGFRNVKGIEELQKALAVGELEIPFVAKLRKGGYDGKGVFIINTPEDIESLADAPMVIEDKVKIEKEISVIVCRNPAGELKVFPPVEMVFDPEENLVDYLLSPAEISTAQREQAEDLAKRTIQAYNICGLLAIEMFLTSEGTLLINEVAPRPHNSGHQSVKGNITSQFQQHLRGIINYPLGDPDITTKCVMLNILGEKGYSGKARYEGIEKVLAISGASIYIYGKENTKPARKMGHITITGNDRNYLFQKMHYIKKNFKVISKNNQL